ncbi:hypothetical protein GDO78_019551 [Eleutherodactylus coqui]|uniref:Uncharacterized protein n=1 Tax=Eleutherodactylus coqui TaxID=57060 RepID=A0A8J6B4Y6_ELECQ|nr:hypothetical protein GDO78_019551 [Eleutherodactylus coqui]
MSALGFFCASICAKKTLCRKRVTGQISYVQIIKLCPLTGAAAQGFWIFPEQGEREQDYRENPHSSTHCPCSGEILHSSAVSL